MKGLRMILTALAACLVLTALAWAGEMDAGDEEAPVMVEYEGSADLFQCGSLTGEFTRPDEVRLFAEDLVYQQMYNGLKNRQTNIPLSMSNPGNKDWVGSQLKIYFEKVVNDHPELFYVGNRFSYSCGSSVSLVPTYLTFTDSQVAQFNAKVAEIVNLAKTFTTPLEQMLYVHDYLVVNCAYDWDVVLGGSGAANAHNAYGVLVEGNAVCQGYALAFKLIMNELGLSSQCTAVTSDAMNHMWNLVQLNGNWYHVDVTWDDPVRDTPGCAGHNYFLVSDATIRDESHGHYGWSAAVECSQNTYESGHIFNDVSHPIHYWNKTYYFIKSKAVYKAASLTDTGENLGSALLNSGVVWMEDVLYYVAYPYYNVDRWEVRSYSFTDRVERALGVVDYTPQNLILTTKEDPITYYDSIGLRYDGVTDQIIALSSTRQEVLGTYAIPNYPIAWDNETAAVKILGLTDDGKSAGVKCNTSGCTLWAAYYRDGRMVSAKGYPIGSTGLQLVELGAKPSSYDDMKLMLLTGAHAPACEAFSPES